MTDHHRSHDWLQQELADTLDEDFELDLDDVAPNCYPA